MSLTSESLRQEIKKTVTTLHDEGLELLRSMIRIPTVNPPGEYEAISQLLKTACTNAGLDVRLIETPVSVLEPLGLNPPRISVLATLRGQTERPTVIFNAHLDTVPVSDHKSWICDPFSADIIDGKVYGRGAMDSKGRIAGYFMAIKALKQLQVPLRGSVILAATCDEEIGGYAGPGYLVDAGLLNGDYAIVEGYTDALITAMCGVLQFEITTTGKACHALDPDKGDNAIYQMSRVAPALADYHRRLRQRPSSIPGIQSATCSVGTITGGVKTNVVPDHCAITVDRRVTPGESIDAVTKEVMGLLTELQASDPSLKVNYRELLRADPHVTDATSPFVQLIQKNFHEVTSQDIVCTGLAGFSDARFFANNLGIPTVNFGPGRRHEANAHGANENLRIEDLVTAAEVCALTVVDLLGDHSL